VRKTYCDIFTNNNIVLLLQCQIFYETLAEDGMSHYSLLDCVKRFCLEKMFDF